MMKMSPAHDIDVRDHAGTRANARHFADDVGDVDVALCAETTRGMTTPRADNTSHPYFLVTGRTGHIETRGQSAATFGHRINSISHGVDDGIFAGWTWDGTRLLVSNDRYGFQPLFWSRLPGDGVGVSPSLLTLIEQGA